MNFREITNLAQEYDKTLQADDSRFRRSVAINHEDGSHFHCKNAFLLIKEDWIIVFTEHFGTHIFDQSDLSTYYQYSQINELEELKV